MGATWRGEWEQAVLRGPKRLADYLSHAVAIKRPHDGIGV